jgi:S1-C subfamily serine protease
MTTNRKVFILIAITIGLFVICSMISLAIYLPYRDRQVKAETVRTEAVEQPTSIFVSKATIFAPKNTSHKIPFETVVLISALYKENGQFKEGWTGSGTFISSDGLILTNAHVVLPDKYFKVDALTIAPTINPDEKPEPLYFAKVVQADASLDLAVIKITSDLAGNPVDPAKLNFPFVQLGDSDQLSLGDKLTILGYPGIGGDTITLTSGEVAGFTGESNYGNRAFIKTSATIAGGNSGGLAADDAGNLVGIPTQLGSGSETGIVDCRTLADTNGDGVVDSNDSCVPTGGFINSLRPIKLALPLIEAAKRGEENIVAEISPKENPAPESGNVLHHDDFSDTASGWTVQINDPDGIVRYANGEYQIEVASPQKYISGTSNILVQDAILEVTARVRKTSGQGDFGLICRRQQDGSFYAFEVREDGYASIWKNINNEITPLGDWEYFQGLEGQPELHLTAACLGNQLELAVDGKSIMSTKDSDLIDGDAGLIAGTLDKAGLIVGFDDFSIRAPN